MLAATVLFAWQPATCFGLNALCFLLAAFSILRIRGRQGTWHVPDKQAAEHHSLRSQVLAGLRFLLRDPALRLVVGVVGGTAMLTSGINAVATLYAIEVIHLPAPVRKL